MELVLWYEQIVKVEGRENVTEKEKIVTITQQQPPIEVKLRKEQQQPQKQKYKNRSAGERECFWRKANT